MLVCFVSCQPHIDKYIQNIHNNETQAKINMSFAVEEGFYDRFDHAQAMMITKSKG